MLESAPFENPEAMTDPNLIHARELEIVSEHPNTFGYNLESSSITDPQTRQLALTAKDILDSGSQFSDVISFLQHHLPHDETTIAKLSHLTEDSLHAAIDNELSKDQLLDDTLSKLPDGTKFRINPHAPLSPFSLPQATISHDASNNPTIHIDDYAIEQIKKIKNKTKNSELTVVISQIHTDQNGNLTSDIPSDATDYIALCQSFIEQSGYNQQSGQGLVLELGNECNMCHQHGGIFSSNAFPSHSDPIAYGNFYFDTASALKSTYPNLKLSLSGTAFYDPDFIEQAIHQIQTRADVGGLNTPLIDIISFHPYRRTVEYATTTVQGEGYTSTQGQTFEDQLSHLKSLAKPLGATVTIGEVSFYQDDFGESINELEMYKNAEQNENSLADAPITYIWPGERIVH